MGSLSLGVWQAPERPGERQAPKRSPWLTFHPRLSHLCCYTTFHKRQEGGKKKVLRLHQPCPVPTIPAAGAEALPAAGAPPGPRGRAQGRAERRVRQRADPARLRARGAAGPPRAGGCSALPGPRGGRQVSGAAPLHPRCAAAPPLAAQGRGDPEERRRPPRPRTPGCSSTGEGRAASNKPLHNRRLPQGT